MFVTNHSYIFVAVFVNFVRAKVYQMLIVVANAL